ncbi:MAG: alpha/beta fold hydrolase [Gemmataceae bacterium]|nr:alpha/beta fold hydrolase [Gemmataceae bacterium]
MSCVSRPLCFVLLAFSLLVIGIVPDLSAQGQVANTEPINITTIDGVKLRGNFFQSAKKNAPVVIMLHPIGEGKSSRVQDWKKLAETLQKKGYSVVTFDFRGHGESTTIDVPDDFRIHPVNRNNVKTKDSAAIEVKDYIKSIAYMPVLVNDIAAIRAYLDRKNDDGACSTSNILVLGAESGATLGAIWMNAEWNRYRLTPPSMFGKLPTVEKRSEGHDIIGAAFLTLQPTIGSRTFGVSNILKKACLEHATAAVFFCGKEDTKMRDFAKTVEKSVKLKKSKKHELIGVSELETNLVGVKLLKTGLDESIVKYFDNVVGERANEWLRRDADTLYIWRDAFQKPVPAKNKKGEKNLLFNNYELYAK